MACLVAVAPGLSETDIVSLVKIDALLLACNMLKYVGDQNQHRKSRAYQAFSVFAGIAGRGPGQTKSKPSRAVVEFFDVHVLGIMAHFSEVLESAQGYTKREKVRCVTAIAEMITVAKKQVITALPQIRAVLQSVMEHESLCEVAFHAWLNLLDVLDGDGIASIVGQTFALILRHWSTFSSELRQVTHDKVGVLIKEHNGVLRENLMTLPSLEDIALLSKVSSEIERLKAGESVENHCKAFT